MLTEEQFKKMNFRDIAELYGMEEDAFLREAYPYDTLIWEAGKWYPMYKTWYGRTQTKLAKALK